MIFLDSSFIIAAFLNSDADHGRAVEISRELVGERLVMTSHNVEESVTFVAKRGSAEQAKNLALKLLFASDIDIVFPDRETLKSAAEVLGRRGGLSMCDALAIVIMQEMGIRTIASFDSDFDRFQGLRRLG